MRPWPTVLIGECTYRGGLWLGREQGLSGKSHTVVRGFPTRLSSELPVHTGFRAPLSTLPTPWWSQLFSWFGALLGGYPVEWVFVVSSWVWGFEGLLFCCIFGHGWRRLSWWWLRSYQPVRTFRVCICGDFFSIHVVVEYLLVQSFMTLRSYYIWFHFFFLRKKRNIPLV